MYTRISHYAWLCWNATRCVGVIRVFCFCCVFVTFANAVLRTEAAVICEDKYHSHHLAYEKCREVDEDGEGEEGEENE